MGNEKPVYDTSVYINAHQKGNVWEKGPFAFTDVNLCEWLKGKRDTKKELSEFHCIENLIRDNGASYRFRNEFINEERIMNSVISIETKFPIAQSIARRVFSDLVGLYFSMIVSAVVLVFLKTNRCKVHEGKFVPEKGEDVQAISNALAKLPEKFQLEKESLLGETDCLFPKTSKDVEKRVNKPCLEMAELLNREIADKGHPMKLWKEGRINYKTFLNGNRVEITDEDILCCLLLLTDFANCPKESRAFFYKTLVCLFAENKSLEFNDVADRYFPFIASQIGVEYSKKHTLDMKSLSKLKLI